MGTIAKALDLLNFFSRTSPEIGLGEFVRLTGRDKATVHRHLVELQRCGFLEQHPTTRAYRLGPAILRLAEVREASHPVRSALRPAVLELAEAAGELVHVSLLQGEMLSPVVHADPMRHGTQVHFDEAEMLPLHATSSGLAALAFADPALAARVLASDLARYTDRTVTDPAALRRLLDEVRATGICRMAQAFDGEVISQGAPVFGPGGAVVGAISIAVPSVRATEAKLDATLSALRAGVRRATRALGGVIPREHEGKWAPDAPAPLPARREQSEV